MDGNDALKAELPMPGMGAPPAASGPQTGESGPAATSDTRVMLAIVTQGRIMRLTMTPVAPLEATIPTSSAVALRSGGAQIARLLALVSPLALLACVLVGIVCFEPTVRPASNRGWLLYGLKGWLATRQR